MTERTWKRFPRYICGLFDKMAALNEGRLGLVEKPGLESEAPTRGHPLMIGAVVEDRPNLNDIHVLVVDDYNDTLELFSAALEQCGGNVLKARTARDALTIIKTVRLNAIISDLAMPAEDGLWLVEQLRRLKSDQGGSIPAIAVTAHRDRYNAERVIALGFEAFLTKPVDPFNLARTVASLVGR